MEKGPKETGNPKKRPNGNFVPPDQIPLRDPVL